MAKNFERPRESDAILGGQNPAPASAVVLGGLEGVKRRLASPDIEQQLTALKEAFNYGEAGLDLALQVWQEELGQLKWAAYPLLCQREEPKVKQALQDYIPYNFFYCIRTLKGHRDWVASVAISPDGQTIASGSYDKIIKLWDLSTGHFQRTLKGHSNSVRSICYSPDGLALVNSDGENIHVWNLQTKQLQSILKGHSKFVHSVCYNPDNLTIVSGSSDNSIKVWNLQTAEVIRTFKKHSNAVYSVCISPDGKTIVSGSKDNTSNDKTIKVWGLRSQNSPNLP
ncbi:WD40 repeat domain-containing protein [Aerosakkonema funiforme]|uniref:WD40 repeat domain-containing protein n=1 Tax=Aerosakkonema funiforme TaxID=1246630 RepID=UPI0035BB2427